MPTLKTLLDSQYELHNTSRQLQEDKPDPLMIAKPYAKYPHFAEIALVCALLSYGNAKAITKMLQKLDFTFLSSESLPKFCIHYRFQTAQDIQELFRIMRLIIANGGIRPVFLNAYHDTPAQILTHWHQSDNRHHARILYAIYTCIELMCNLQSFQSYGLDFLLGKSQLAFLRTHSRTPANASALKRWNMFLRWLVREDSIDVGTWAKDISPSHLILPLDTHTFTLCRSLGILKRKSYDLQSALQATDTLARLRPRDPIAYDFALYRLGQKGYKNNIRSEKRHAGIKASPHA